MATPTPLAQLVHRVEQLLLQHDELALANQQLRAQVAALAAERDLLQSKHAAARARIDALLDRLHPPPATPEAPHHEAD